MIAVVVVWELIDIQTDDYFLKEIVGRLALLLGIILVGILVFIIIRLLPVHKQGLIKRLRRSPKGDKFPYLEGLLKLGEEGVILESWDDFTFEERQKYSASLAILALKDAKALSLLRGLYQKESEPRLRAALAEAIYEIEGDEFMSELWELSRVPSPEVRAVTYRIFLARLKNAKGTEDERCRYVRSLAKLGRQALAVLIDLYHHEKQGSKLHKALSDAIREIDPKASLLVVGGLVP